MSDTPRTDALQEELAAMSGPECLYTEEMADRMWFLMREFEERLTYLYANCIGDSMALGIMQLQRRELADARRELAAKAEECEALRKDAERYRWILHQGPITDFIFKFLKSYERHVSNAIDAAREGK